MIAVTFALPNESSDFVRLLRDGRLHGKEIRVLHTGVGEKMARQRLVDFFRREKPRLLISSGFAGAINDELKIGDLLLAENFSSSSLAAALKNVRRGALTTASTVVDSQEERIALAERQGAIAVDMETEFIAQLCAENSIPMISLRAISDTPAAPLGFPAAVLFNLERQRTPYGALLFYLLKRPSALSRLLTLAKRIARARQVLARGLEQAIHRVAES